MEYIVYDTPCGAIRGINGETCVEFRGIRYAAARRFAYPEQVRHWDGIYDATEYGACACQHRAFDDDAKVNAFYHKEFRKGLTFTYSEDCLFLNIWAPKKAENCPVLIYIHGGSFTGGSANEGHISGVEFARNGVIMVACNYRLGPFGFCSHPDLTDEKGICGNFGLYDQTAAIRWVRANISAFGGNPDKMTLMGQSAGAISVSIHLSNPLVKNDISGAIMLSGAGLQRFLLKPLPPAKTVSFWNKVMRNAGVDTMSLLKTSAPETLYYAWLDARKECRFSIPYTFPVYDGVILQKGNFSVDTIADVPYMIGSTWTDMSPILLQYLNKKWGRYVEKHRKSSCYLYNFTRCLPGDDKGAWHSSDLLYAFSTLDFNWRPFEKTDYEIARQLSQAICAFVKNGDPNCDAIPEWPSGYKRPMHFCENTHCAKWDTFHNLRNTFSHF